MPPKGNPPTTPDTQNCRVDTKNTVLTGTGAPKFDGAREIRRAPRNGNASPVVGGVGVVVVVITGVVDATNVVANVVVVLVVLLRGVVLLSAVKSGGGRDGWYRAT